MYTIQIDPEVADALIVDILKEALNNMDCLGPEEEKRFRPALLLTLQYFSCPSDWDRIEMLYD